MWNKKTVALELGARTLKGLALKKAKGRVVIDNYFFHDMAVGNEMYPLECPTEETLKALIEVHDFSGKKIVTCLDDKDILTHECRLPNMPKADFELAVTNEIEEHLSLPIAEAVYEHVLLETIKENETVFKHIEIYAARSAAVIKIKKTVEASSMQVSAIESGALARAAMLDFNGYLQPEKCYVALDLGESHITATLIRNKKVVLNNVLTMGMGLVNKTLFETQGLPYETSEELKIAYDSHAEEHELDENQKIIDEVFYQVFYKVQRLIEFFRVHLKTEHIDSILATGGGSQLHNIDKILETYCSLPAVVVNPFQKIDIYAQANPKDDKIAILAPYMATVVGMALRGLE